MTNMQLNFLKTILLNKKKDLEAETYIKYEYENDTEKFKDDEDTDDGDIALKANILDFMEKKAMIQKKELCSINLALQKMEHNLYGLCEESGEEIEFERLKANPVARYSIEVQRMIENGY